MPDEEPVASQPTAELLRRPEVLGDEHASEPVPELEPDAQPAPDAESARLKLPPARARLIGVGIGGIAIVALVAGAVLLARPAAVATSSPTAARSASLAADANGTAVSATPSIAEPSATAEPSEPEGSPTPEPTEIVLAPDAGRIVFGDDFRDTSGGWPTGSTGLTTISLGKGFYAIAGKGNGTDHLVEAPFQPRIKQIAVTALATQTNGRGTAGFGVTCGATTVPTPADVSLSAPAEASPAAASPEASHVILFEFVVLNSGGWLVERRDGSPDRVVQPIVLMHGNTNLVPGARPLTVSGICASSADGSRTRLIFAVNGTKLIEFSDASATVTQGWHGGLVVSTVNTTASAVFRHFDVRDLAAKP